MAPSAKIDRISRKMHDEGWDDGPGVSAAFYVREGDVLELGFRGNIQPDLPDDERDNPLRLVYNSQLTMSFTFDAIEVNKYELVADPLSCHESAPPAEYGGQRMHSMTRSISHMIFAIFLVAGFFRRTTRFTEDLFRCRREQRSFTVFQRTKNQTKCTTRWKSDTSLCATSLSAFPR